MYNVSLRLMGNEDDAKDAVQEAFITAFRKLGSLGDFSLFSAWLKKIVVNTCLNSLKKRKEIFQEIGEKDFPDNDDYSKDDFDYNSYRANQVLEAINELADGARTVLTLYLFEGYDHKEIGEILGITESASKAQYSKAKSKIRKILSEEMRF